MENRRNEQDSGKTIRRGARRLFFAFLAAGLLLTAAGCSSPPRRKWPESAPVSGAAALAGGADVPNSPYFPRHDFFRGGVTPTLRLIAGFRTCQQTTEYTCGAAALWMVLRHWGMADKTERALAEELDIRPEDDPRSGAYGCSRAAIETALKKRGVAILPHREFDSAEAFAELVKKQLARNSPLLVEWSMWGGHWTVVIGCDDMGTETVCDDVLILADPYDTADHCQDGYVVVSLERFFHEWFDAGVLSRGITRQQYVAPVKPETAGAPTAAEPKRFVIMGTHGAFHFSGDPAERSAAEQSAMDELERVQKLCNLFDPESELARLNAGASRAPFPCSEELYEILAEARRAWRETDGAFDITAKPLMDLWGFYRRRDAMPSRSEVAEVRAKTGLEKVRFCDEKRTVFFSVPGMALDLGGIAKGCAVDRAFAAALRTAAAPLLVDVGGNLKMRSAPEQPFFIGLRDPFGAPGAALTLSCREGACATSGGYERFVTYAGRRYPHILDPATGFPGSGVLAVTVVAPSAAAADWMSTAVFLRGKALAEKLARNHPGTRFYLFEEETAAERGRYRLTVVPDGASE